MVPNAVNPFGEVQTPLVHSLNETEFNRIAQIAESDFGLYIEPSKRAIVQARLNRRLQELGLVNFSEYCSILEQGGLPERRRFISAITTNVTHFFREAHHFDHFRCDVLPRLKERAHAGDRIRLWSCGCSTGAEPFSLVSCVIDGFPSAGKFDFKVLATDLDEDVLEQAILGEVPHNQAASLTQPQMHRIFENNASKTNTLKIKQQIKDLITFAPLNIVDEFPMSGQFDVIFCRNVLIYFEPEMQKRIWQKFADKTNDKGILYIGHSERIIGEASLSYDQIGTTIYSRRSRQ